MFKGIKMTLTIVSPTAMIFFCILIFACIPWLLAMFATMLGRTVKGELAPIGLLFALAGWALGYAFFSTP